MINIFNIARGKTLLSHGLYIILNVLLAAATLLLVLVTNSPIPSCILVLLGKWRIFAVRPRYWLANIRANLVDLVVGLSIASCLFLMGEGHLVAQVVLTVFYAVWLVVIKPSSKPVFVIVQAGVALVLSTIAATSLCYGLPPVVLVILSAVIGYATFKHILTNNLNDESNPELASLTAGLVMAELSWAAYHWLVAYNVPGTGLKVPQFTIIAAMIGFIALTLYRAHDENNKFKFQDAVVPIIFSVAIIAVMMIAFSGASIDLS